MFINLQTNLTKRNLLTIDDVLKNFNPAPKKTKSAYKYKSPKKFYQYGTCIDREYDTYDIIPEFSGNYTMLGDIIEKNNIPMNIFESFPDPLNDPPKTTICSRSRVLGLTGVYQL